MVGSALLLAYLLTGSGSYSSPLNCPHPSAHWSAAAAVPADVRQLNILRLEDGRLLWNGTDVSENHVRQYLGIVNSMHPQPLMVLIYGEHTSCESIERARSLIDEVLQCQPGQCLEVPGESLIVDYDPYEMARHAKEPESFAAGISTMLPARSC